ncbi:MAG: guanylate kinase [Candidatus Margulisbacteria bacterium]|nr:guanylate kinase [Candidatus Margulisiibacteriota bacterium]
MEKTKKKSKKGLGVIISGPSGVGKGTIINKLLEKDKNFSLSVSYCTRKARKHEKNGIDYHFISVEEFKKIEKNKGFAEWAEVHKNFYGTSMDYVNKLINGEKIIFEVDVQGAKSLISLFEEKKYPHISFFLIPPSLSELINRLENRGTEDPKSLKIRFDNARKELTDSSYFNYSLINARIESTVENIYKLIKEKEQKNE